MTCTSPWQKPFSNSVDVAAPRKPCSSDGPRPAAPDAPPVEADPHRCPTCNRRMRLEPAMTRLRLKLLSVGSEWVTVRVGASRSYVFKIRQRYPEFEWQAELITAQGPGEGSWRVMARRR